MRLDRCLKYNKHVADPSPLYTWEPVPVVPGTDYRPLLNQRGTLNLEPPSLWETVAYFSPTYLGFSMGKTLSVDETLHKC